MAHAAHDSRTTTNLAFPTGTAKHAVAKSLVDELIDKLDESSGKFRVVYSERRVGLKKKFLVNRQRFVEMEAPENLAWLIEDYFPGKKLVIWRGLGG